MRLKKQNKTKKKTDHRACLQENCDIFPSRGGRYRKSRHFVNVRALLTPVTARDLNCEKWTSKTKISAALVILGQYS